MEWTFRFVLAAAAVGICYLFQWRFLRYLTSELNLRVDALFGVMLQRLSADTVVWKGIVYHYENACIFADVWCASIPLLWARSRTLSQNLPFITLYTSGLFVFNVLRLSFSDVLYAAGVPWSIAHNFVGGIAWFVVWIWIWKRVEKIG